MPRLYGAAFTAVRSISAVTLIKFRGLRLILVDGAQIGVFKVFENSSISGFLDGDDGGGFKTVFLLKTKLLEESS